MFLTAAVGMLYYFIDEMYLAEALLLQSTAVELSFDAIQQSIQFGTWSVVSLLLLWAAITTVKLSFLALFRKLIDRMGPMVRYWWCVFAFVVIVALFGISAYIAPCPVFWDLRACELSKKTLSYKDADWENSILLPRSTSPADIPVCNLTNDPGYHWRHSQYVEISKLPT